MNPPAPPRRHQLWPWIVGLVLAPFVILGSMVAGAFRLDSDAVALRRQITAATGDCWATQLQFSVPAAGVGLARSAAYFVRDLPPEARDGLAVMRSASVGVYSRRGAAAARSGGEFMADTDRMMAGRGWMRIVGVIDGSNTVLIYLPAGDGQARPDRVCLAVCAEQQLVVVAARFDGRALARLVDGAVRRHALAQL